MSGPIIITVPNNYLVDEESKVVVDVTPSPSRKRRLDHLSWEEKMQRKKMKNRVAAQTSRDRKKAKMDEMESRIQNLEERNVKLMSEMESLRALNERLASENRSLNERLASENRAAAARTVSEAPGPAESPQQKAGPPAAVRLLLAMMLLSQSSSRTSSQRSTSTPSISLQTPSSRRLVQALQERLKMSKSGTLESALKELKWWGPQQSTWNPVKVLS